MEHWKYGGRYSGHGGLNKPFYYVKLSSVGEGRKLESGLEINILALNLLKNRSLKIKNDGVKNDQKNESHSYIHSYNYASANDGISRIE